MSQLQVVTNALEGESQFRPRYQAGMPRHEHWRWMLEDGLDLLARLHQVAAAIYRRLLSQRHAAGARSGTRLDGAICPDAGDRRPERLTDRLHAAVCDHACGS